MARQPYKRRQRRIPKQRGISERLGDILDEAVMEKFGTLYSAHPFTRTHDNEYHLSIGSLEVIVYMKGANIVTELRSVPDSNAESTLITLLEKDEFFSHEKSPVRKQKQTLAMYVRLFKRTSKGNSFEYVPQKSIKRALSRGRAQIIDTIIDYMIKPLLFLLPGPSQTLEKMH